jgi:metalloendopeptidase OMA1, mitochondrial
MLAIEDDRATLYPEGSSRVGLAIADYLPQVFARLASRKFSRAKRSVAMMGLAATFLVLFSGCASLLGADSISDEQINLQSQEEYAKVKAQSKRSTNAVWTAMVDRVAKRIAAASGENFQWEVMLVDNKEPNAWCMPGGKMAVYTGIMPILKTEAALAAVMGHEVAHATLRHGKERLVRGMQSQMTGAVVGIGAGVIASAFCQTESCRQMTQLGGALGGLGVTFFSLKYDRGNESEADRAGQIYMAKAGYDPNESIRLWERMGAASGGKSQPEWLSTHPSDSTRSAQLRAMMGDAQAEYARAPNKFGLGEPIR